MKNSLARDLSIASVKVQYDDNIKNILSNKVILAWILKSSTTEFYDLTIERIVECIEDEPEISAVRVNPGETNESEKIVGSKNEDKVPMEGTVYYDIRFQAYVPIEGKYIKILLNLEAQKNFYPGYQIVTRGVFYGGRMISAQLDTEFEIPDYDGLKKVYSIWLCVQAPKKIGNAISRYSLEKEDVVSGIPDKKEAYDKLSIVMICLNEKMETKTEFLELMNVLLSRTMSVDDKMRILEEKFNISMGNKMEKELNLMCNLSDLVEEEAMERGMERGMEKKLEEHVEKMFRKGWTIVDIADLLEESIEAIQDIVQGVKRNCI